MSLRSINDDVMGSLGAAMGNHRALDRGLDDLRDACSNGRWGDVEKIRERLLAAIDGYVDHYSAACRRLEAEGIKR